MTDWLGTFLEICARRGDMLFQPLPAWVWTRDGANVCWANPAGAEILGAESLDQVSRLSLPPDSALRRDIANIARRLGQGPTLSRLRFFRGARTISLACRCERLVLPDGQVTVLIDAREDMQRRDSPGDTGLASYLAFAGNQVVIADAGRRVLADGGTGLEAGDLPEISVTRGPGNAEVELGNRRARFRYVQAGQNPGAPVFHWVEFRAADPVVTAESDQEPVQESIDGGRPQPASQSGEDGEPVVAVVDDEPESDIGQPKVPGETASDGEFSRQARMLRSALRKSAETAAEHDPAAVSEILENLPKKPVRFLWQTDAEDRFLFVSPGLEQLVGRSSQIVGERWDEIADRMRLDPVGRVSQALAGQDTWSGFTAWWPTEDRAARIPAELTALPVFAIDQSFQGYRGFGVLKPAEAMSASAFDRRFPGDPLDSLDAGFNSNPESGNSGLNLRPSADRPAQNIVPIRDDLDRLPDFARLSPQERSAFDEIALALKTHEEEVQSAPPRIDADPPAADPSDSGGKDDEYGEYSTDANDPYFLASLPDDDDAYPPDADEICPDDFDTLVLAGDDSTPAVRQNGTLDPSANDDEAPDGGSVSEPGTMPPAANDDVASTGAGAAASGDGGALQTVDAMQSVLDLTADGILVLDGAGTVVQHNAIAQAIFGVVDDSLVGRPLTDLIHEDSRQSTIDYLAAVGAGKVDTVLGSGHEVSLHRGEDIIPIFMKIGALPDLEDETRFAVVIRDISRWKNVEADLIARRQAAEQASGQKSEFLARVSHEIRTPLNAIIGFAEVMIEERFGPVENERYREYLRDIRTSGEHVVSLVNDLLDISKIEAGKLDLSFAAVPLNELVRECVTLMQPQANRSKVIVRSSLAGRLPSIISDARTMRQVVLNLLSNSIKFTGSGGQVIVSTNLTDQGDAVLRVRDTGTGMSEDDLARALEPFRQLSTSRIGGENGTGLGLPLTKALVEANRAVFDISSAPGEGTIVRITFPAARVLPE